MIIEGVHYFRHRVRFRLKDAPKRRRQITVWSPGYPWVRAEVARMLDDRHGIEAIVPGSVKIRMVPS